MLSMYLIEFIISQSPLLPQGSIEADRHRILHIHTFSPNYGVLFLPCGALQVKAKLTPAPNLLALKPEQQWKRKHRNRKEANQARAPIDPESSVHILCKQWERRAK